MSETLEWVEIDKRGRHAYQAYPHLWDRFTGDMLPDERIVAEDIVTALLNGQIMWYDHYLIDFSVWSDCLSHRHGERDWKEVIDRFLDIADRSELPLAACRWDRRGRGNRAMNTVLSGRVVSVFGSARGTDDGRRLLASIHSSSTAIRILRHELFGEDWRED